MTDPTPSGPSGRRLPPPLFFDPSFERLPTSVAWDARRPGPVLLLFDPAAERAWVADAAIALATGWTQAGRRTVLADLSLDDPLLHERIGMANQDGVADIFLYGASLARSARPVPGRGFLLISAGTYTTDPAGIYRDPRWEKIVSVFREGQASLLMAAPVDAPGLDALLARTDDVIVLAASDGEDRVLPLLDERVGVRAWLTPPAQRGAAAAPAASAPFPEPAPSPPAPVVPPAPPRRPAGEDAPLPAAADVPQVPAAELPVPEPGWEEAPPAGGGGLFGRRARGPARAGGGEVPPSEAGRRTVSPLLIVLLLLVIVAAALYAASPFLGPWWERAQGGDAAEGGPAAPRAASSGGPASPAGTELPYAVFNSGYPTLEAARRQAAAVQAAAPTERVFVVPEERGGQVYYMVMTGMLADTAQARALRTDLVDAGVVSSGAVTTASDLIQSRPLAFDLGERAGPDEANAALDTLLRAGIPAYAAPVPMTDGSERWRLYGGAFRDSASAETMRGMLAEAGVEARLVERAGRAPASPK